MAFTLIRIMYGHEKLQFDILFDYIYYNHIYRAYSNVFMNIISIS